MSEYILSEDLAVWFGKKKKKKGSSQPKGPWVNICRKKEGGGHPPCGRGDADKGAYPVCRGAGVASKMSQSAKDSACRRKREKEKKDPQSGKGQKPTRIKIKDYKKKTKKESVDTNLIKNILKEYSSEKVIMSEELQYHINNKISLTETMFRYGSPKYFKVINEARELYNKGMIIVSEEEKEILESDLGKVVKTKTGKTIPLDFPMVNEAEYKGKKVELNKPKTGGPKKWFVYVRDPQSKNIKKVSYGSPDMSANWNNPEARKSFAARHQCEKKKDKTKPGYWACRAHKDFGKNVSGRFW
jgi:hypothetical protein